MTEPRLYSTRITALYIAVTRQRYPHVDIAELLRAARIDPSEVHDKSHWLTQTQVNRFHEALTEATGANDIARQAGRYAASPKNLGPLRHHALGLAGLMRAFEALNDIVKRVSKSTTYETRRLGASKVEVRVVPRPGVQEEPFQCENRKGWLEALVSIFTGTLPTVEHPECIFQGSTCCRYVIQWHPSILGKITRFMQLGGWLALLSALVAVALVPQHWHAIGIGTALVWLTSTALSGLLENRRLHSVLADTSQQGGELLDQLERTYNNAQLTWEIGEKISRSDDADEIVALSMRIIDERLSYDRAAVYLTDEKRTRLRFCHGFGWEPEQLRMLLDTEIEMAESDSPDAIREAFDAGRPIVIDDVDAWSERFGSKSLQIARALGSNAFVFCPVMSQDKGIGVLVVDRARSGAPLERSDVSLLMGIAHMLGINLQNAQLLQRRDRQLQSMIRALAASIDARDPLTAGHSEKVTEYCLAICDTLGLSGDRRELVQVAALLHDYGKIGVPDAVLKKPGRLTPEEYEVVKEHSERTRTILMQIDFTGALANLPDIAAAHHEKLNGTGYPRGLSADEITLESRIIAVADIYEAVTAKRHYRDPMPKDEAVRLLHDEVISGHLDGQVVKAFCKWLDTETTPG